MLALPRKKAILLLKSTLFGISIVLVVLASLSIVRSPPRHLLSAATTESRLRRVDISSQLKTDQVGMPIRLRIPAINVDAAVESVGLTPDGAMDIKKNQENTAWYKFGPRPGTPGNAVIAGHYGWDHQKASVFTQLSQLQKGDIVYVDDDNRASTAFIVREMKKYPPDADATAVFNSSDGGSHLNLITCGGAWEAAQETYSDRLVVFTDKA